MNDPPPAAVNSTSSQPKTFSAETATSTSTLSKEDVSAIRIGNEVPTPALWYVKLAVIFASLFAIVHASIFLIFVEFGVSEEYSTQLFWGVLAFFGVYMESAALMFVAYMVNLWAIGGLLYLVSTEAAGDSLELQNYNIYVNIAFVANVLECFALICLIADQRVRNLEQEEEEWRVQQSSIRRKLP
ncbi:hypothetical protein Q1695_003374 [Nippostrongylus brasiliensis]|nr:hypothetical protein Q1695_003374 [Nippostrongylus brasiliensis]